MNPAVATLPSVADLVPETWQSRSEPSARGMIGQDHIRGLSTVQTGSAIVAVSDLDEARVRRIADTIPGARVHATGRDLSASSCW